MGDETAAGCGTTCVDEKKPGYIGAISILEFFLLLVILHLLVTVLSFSIVLAILNSSHYTVLAAKQPHTTTEGFDGTTPENEEPVEEDTTTEGTTGRPKETTTTERPIKTTTTEKPRKTTTTERPTETTTTERPTETTTTEIPKVTTPRDSFWNLPFFGKPSEGDKNKTKEEEDTKKPDKEDQDEPEDKPKEKPDKETEGRSRKKPKDKNVQPDDSRKQTMLQDLKKMINSKKE